MSPPSHTRPAGSSPLTRGKPSEKGRERLKRGLIPAHAGKTVLDNAEYFTAWAHPRSRGENALISVTEGMAMGSSPLTRGKRPTRQPRLAVRGLIPAHAGKTARRNGAAARQRAHPRSRGENRVAHGHGGAARGSSPLTRGKLVRVDGDCAVLGLIPAHAGKTIRAGLLINDVEAHPRSRGENGSEEANARVRAGSSPLTRGKPPLVRRTGGSRRLIPAHAGKTPPNG